MKKILFILVTALFAFSTTVNAETNWKSYRIMIDPGHGGTDSGATGPSAPHEKTLALWCGSQLYANITGSSLNGYSKRINNTLSGTVKMTRSTDVFISLSSRKSASVSYDPYIFCSIHLNAYNTTAKGTEVWYYWTTGNSNALANKVYSTLMSEFGTVSGFTPTGRGVKRNGWTVITGSSSIPAILTEGLFVDNKTEWGIIKAGGTAAGFQAWANGHLKGFYNHLKTLKADIINPFASGSTTTDPTLTVDPTSISFSCTEGETRTDKIAVQQTATTAACSVTVSGTNAAMFTVDKTSIAKATNGTVTVTYKPTAIGSHSATITFKTGSLSKTTKLTGTCTSAPLSFTQKWNFSDKKGTLTSKGWDAGKVRNMTYRSGKLYLVYDHSDIKVVNAQTGADLGNLNKKDVTGGTLTLCDVRICSGKIVACNLAAKSGEALRIYVWDDEQDYPRLAMTTTNFGGATRIGDCIGWSGDWTSGKLVFGNDDGTTTRIIEYPVTNGVIGTTPTVVKATTDGTTSIGSSSSTRIYPISSGGYWIQGKQVFVSRLDATGARQYYLDDDVRWGNAWKTFTWKEHKYALMTTFNDMEGENWSSQTDAQKAKNYTGGRMKLLDCADGYAKAVTLGEYPSAGLSDVVQNTNCTTQCLASVTGTTSVEAWVLSTGQGIAYFVSKGDTAPTYTVDPIVQKDDNTPTITASSTSLALSAKSGETANKSITVTGANLSANITAALSGTNASLFSIDKSSIAQSSGSASGSIKVTYAPTSSGTHTATLTLSSTGATTVKVTLTGTATATIDPTTLKLTKLYETVTPIPAEADGRFSTGFGEYVYITDKSSGTIYRYNKTSRSTFATVEGAGVGISSDDAGNIIVNKGFAGAASSTNFVIISADGKTQTALTLDGVSGRLDDFGRVVGNMLSSTGAYLYITPQNLTKAKVVKIVNGAVKSITDSPDTGLTFNMSETAQPAYATVAEIDALSNPAASFYIRSRNTKNIYQVGASVADLGAVTGATTCFGFDVFEFQGKKYAVEPAAAANYGDGIAIRDLTTNEVVASKSLNMTPTTNPGYQSLTARVNADGMSVNIYQNLSGKLVAVYVFSGEEQTGPTETVATPTFSPVAGTYTAAQNVTIACATSGADIYYTLDGSNPTASSTKYTGPIAISASTTVKAIAVKSGMNNSAVATAAYTITSVPVEKPATPTFTPAAGTYSTAQNVTIACATAGAEIRYTLDGAAPSAASALYTGPIAISATTTVKAVAIKDGQLSDVATATYTIDSGSPVDPGEATLTPIWEQKFTSPTSGDARFATGFGGNIYAVDKSTGNILKYSASGVTTFATVEGVGVAISSDDAGNILVNKGLGAKTSFTNWVIIEPNGTQHELTIEAPAEIATNRVDQLGRIVGNVMSADGGYMYLANNTSTVVAVVKVVNGAVASVEVSPTVIALNTSTTLQPIYNTVDEIEAATDPTATFYFRQRANHDVYTWNESATEQVLLQRLGAGGNEGFDIFTYNSKLIGVASTARTTEFVLADMANGDVIANGGLASESVPNQFRAYTVREENGKFGIYVWNAGFSAAYYTYGSTSVDAVGNNAAEVSAAYYNLQGVRVVNPSAGQIYIRVANLSDGSVRTSKVVVK
ncbi:MAG: chitobiase/beta-hexosaminidase C-terminal domain-containing protein [Muribaculaceae bacterium]|nr:chitobiase/beta-hexosaminidase C-terminal domain-containing protein [Muribaculaceae bacterium]